MYSSIFNIGNIVFYICLGTSFLLLIEKIIYHIVGLFPSKKFPEAKKNYKYAFLIPARNESKVIESLLQSIQNQEYEHELIDTYVIVESEEDPTCEIVKKYPRTHIFIRKHLEMKGKGYALDEAVQDIFAKDKIYDAFFICDADNVLSPTFVREMNKTYDAGYEISLGYRNSKNWNGGWVASCSALTFSMVNTFHNKCRARFNKNVILSGTGLYVSYRVLKELGGWKFYTLTEDYELSLFSSLNNIKSTYNEYAEFYDEQPTKLRVSWNQRIRWVKGHSQSDLKYQGKLIKSAVVDRKNRWSKLEFSLSIIPIGLLLITTIGYMFFTLVLGIIGAICGEPATLSVFIGCIIATGSMYIFFILYTMAMILAEKKHIDITVWNGIKCCLMNPLFMGLYIPIFFASLFKKKVTWVPIEHNVNMVTEKESTIQIEDPIKEQKN